MNFPYNVKVLIANNFDYRDDGPWWCQYSVAHNDTKLEIVGYGPTLEAAVEVCNEKYRVFVPVLPLEILSPVVNVKQLTQSDDEIPF